MILDCAGKPLDLTRPRVMGVLNLTPDSFSDGGLWLDPERALAHAHAMVEAGAAIIDLGGESTRPGAEPVDAEEEMRRVVPLVTRLAAELEVPVSVDTTKPEVMRAAIAAGAGMVNDVRALRAPGALEAVADSGVAVCLMHMQGEPRTMQQAPHYDDVSAEVLAFLLDRADACVTAGIAQARIVLDPGFGFGKTLEHNLTLMAELDRFVATSFPILVGVSRKAMIGALTGAPVERRLAGSVAAAVIAATRGARILRVHDVADTVDALAVAEALEEAV
jgi:dihydropteroate synthase